MSPSGRLSRVAIAALLAAGGVGCAHRVPTSTQQDATPREEESRRVTIVIDEDGPWREIPARDPPREDVTTIAAPPPAVLPRPAASAPAPFPSLAVPARRATTEPPPLGTVPNRSPEERARERHLEHPTRIVASAITFYCPAPYLPEVRLSAADVSEPQPGRRVGIGQARLLCRELTLEADRIVLRARPAGEMDVQVTARGGVAFVTDQRGQVFRHEGVRLLILTNDQVTPLR